MSEPTHEMFRAVLQSKYDEGNATLRELIRRSGDEAIARLMEQIIPMTESNDAGTAILGAAAIVGLSGAWLSKIESEGDQ